ncbi:beta-ketoacyl-ACP reductase [Actinocatenispora thailandica]|uniref:Beta-ketoacyl-ACP reductase n=1 Tax=Actinocatenispora thailandica TaxID=227318 RepID=A0A7R7DNX8_9ACTN|nr:SDR family NAD(P)-dependent oxidoreductase [Actinocatenispora thailandica]BCJ35128.1 beta-ketoacyl-ACP reductase [Actinocatenispora thailandica]
MGTLDGQIALVTGSSRGIGAGIAAELARQGAAVAVHGRDAAAVADVVARLRDAGGSALGVTGDVTRLDDIEAIRARLEAELGPVRILVANAGGSPTPPAVLEDISEQDWRAGVDTNLLATFLTLKCFLPGMKQRRAGSIVTISSAAGRRAHPRSPMAYAAAKAGIDLLTQQVAAQAGPYGIRANCVAPETIMTERNARMIPAGQQETLTEMHPLRRLGTPDDVARAVAFLVADGADWITGTVLDVAGGAVMV